MRLNLPPLEGINPDHTSRRDERSIIAAALREWAMDDDFTSDLDFWTNPESFVLALAAEIDPDKEKG